MERKIIVIEDNRDVAEAYKLLLNGISGMKCTAIYYNAEDALSAYSEQAFDADVICMDIELPGKSGIECIAELKLLGCTIPIMVLTAFDNDSNVFDALRAGALGYVLKSSTPLKILSAIEELADGGSPMTGTIARKVLQEFSAQTPASDTDVLDNLSKRENEILNALVSGKRYQEIADLLFISLDTVRTHVRNVYKKLHVHNIKEARRILRKR